MNLLYGEYLTGREKSRSEVLAGIQETVNAVSQHIADRVKIQVPIGGVQLHTAR